MGGGGSGLPPPERREVGRCGAARGLNGDRSVFDGFEGAPTGEEWGHCRVRRKKGRVVAVREPVWHWALDCPYYKEGGTCRGSRYCYVEPACVVDTPLEGWVRRYRWRDERGRFVRAPHRE